MDDLKFGGLGSGKEWRGSVRFRGVLGLEGVGLFILEWWIVDCGS